MLSQTSFNFAESDISDFDDILSSSNRSSGRDQTLSSLGHGSGMLDSAPSNSGIATDETFASGGRKINVDLGEHDDPFETGHTREFYRGTSFRFAGRWKQGVHYIHDEYIVDFVVKGSVLLVCTQSHMSDSENEPQDFIREGQEIVGIDSPYWDLVLAGGIRGKAYRPRYDIDSDSLIWTLLDPEHLPDEYTTYLGLQNAIKYLVSPLTDRMENIDHAMMKLDRDVADMEVVSNHLSSQMSDLDNNYSRFEQTVNGFIIEVQNFSGDISSLQMSAKEFDIRVSNVEGDTARLNIQADEIQTRVENSEGDISELHQRADQIWTQVENDQGDISKISQRADKIEVSVQNAYGDMSLISQRAEEIASEVSNAEGDISQISQRADEITSRIENNEGDISLLDQKADEISSTVRNAQNDISQIIQRADLIEQTVKSNKEEADGSFLEMESKIRQTSEEISSEVSATRTEFDNKIEAANSRITQQANLIETKVSQTDYDIKIGQIEQNNSQIEQRADRISQSVEKVTGDIDNVDRTLASYITSNDEMIDMILNQIDGAIDTWFFEGIPTLNNLPASGWDPSEYNDHLGDLYYDKLNGGCYRFLKDGNTYDWVEVQDDALAQALALAQDAYDVATDHKRRIFITQPTPPYDEGDLWVQGHVESGNNAGNGMIMRCIRSRATGSFNASDWDVAFDMVTVKIAKSSFDIFADAIQGRVWQQDPNGIITSATYSNVKQTVDTINLHIENTKSALRATGIDIYGVEFDAGGNPINGGTVVITADNFKIQANDSQVQDPINITIVNGHPVIDTGSINVSGIFQTQAWNTANQNALNAFYDNRIANIAEQASGISGFNYLKTATNNGTLISGGLVLTSTILFGAAINNNYTIMSGITGVADTTKYGNGIAAWYGGEGLDRYYPANTDENNAAKTLFRMDGSGYLAKRNIEWEADGSGNVAQGNISWDANGQLTVKGGILTTELRAGYSMPDHPFIVMSGISGDYDNVISNPSGSTPLGHGIAAWFGGDRIDKEIVANADNPAAATSLFRFDGSGYLANGQIAWGPSGSLRLANNVVFGDGSTTTNYILQNVIRLASYFADEEITLDGVTRHILRINTDGQNQNDPGFIGIALDGLILASGDLIVGDTNDLRGLPREEVRHVLLSQQEWEDLERPDPSVIYMIYES